MPGEMKRLNTLKIFVVTTIFSSGRYLVSGVRINPSHNFQHWMRFLQPCKLNGNLSCKHINCEINSLFSLLNSRSRSICLCSSTFSRFRRNCLIWRLTQSSKDLVLNGFVIYSSACRWTDWIAVSSDACPVMIITKVSRAWLFM